MNRTDGRNRALALSACCAVLCALCVLLAGRYEVERRGAQRAGARAGRLESENALLWRALAARESPGRESSAPREGVPGCGAEILERELERRTESLRSEADLLRRAGQDLSRRLKHYEAAYPEPEAARRDV